MLYKGITAEHFLFRKQIKKLSGFKRSIKGVEIGILNGETSSFLLSLGNIDLIGIDPLIPDSMEISLIGSHDKIIKHTKRFKDKFTFYNDYSYNVIDLFNDKSLHFIFIDGSHHYEDVLQDYNLYLPKIKVGGLIFIHDSRMNRGGPGFHVGPSKLVDELIATDERVGLIGEAFSLTCFKKKGLVMRKPRCSKREKPMKHKYLITFSIWNKEDMITTLMDAIEEHTPDDTLVHFMFDDPQDKSVDNFKAHAKKSEREWAHTVFNDEVQEIYTHRHAMTLGAELGCRAVICYQDDMRLTGPIIEHVEAMLDHYGDTIGIAGGRDGYDGGYHNMISSRWSESVNIVRWLTNGEHAPSRFLNPGPMIYPMSTYEKVGPLPKGFKHFYIWDAYCGMCLSKGLQNVVIGTSLEHKKFGKVLASTFYSGNAGAEDMAQMLSIAGQQWSNLK